LSNNSDVVLGFIQENANKSLNWKKLGLFCNLQTVLGKELTIEEAE
jgi:hypothetical protein